jgi:uncharacterized protein (DUF427 family)
MRAVLRGKVIAQSDDVVFLEGNVYFPAESVDKSALQPSKMVTPCFWKGLARYHHIEVDGVTSRNAAWSYPRPFPWIRRIRGHVAFWGDVSVEP